MSSTYDGDYYSGSGYGNNYGTAKFQVHFDARAQWIIDIRSAENFTGEIWEIGAGWGHVVKATRDLLPAGQKSSVKGIVFSQYEDDMGATIGLTPAGALEVVDAENKIYPDMDMAVSWSFLDSLPPNNENKITGTVNKLINKSSYQMHMLCMDNDDANSQQYKDQGYNIKTLAYWKNKFDGVDVSAGQTCILVDFHTGVNHRKTTSGWETVTGLNIPLLWSRVSN